MKFVTQYYGNGVKKKWPSHNHFKSDAHDMILSLKFGSSVVCVNNQGFIIQKNLELILMGIITSRHRIIENNCINLKEVKYHNIFALNSP